MPTISVVRICNMALSHIGARSNIEDLDEESAEAKQCSLWYDYSRQQLLESFNWSFARKRQALALDVDEAPLLYWKYRYVYPSDALKLRFLENPLGPRADVVPYSIEASSGGTYKTILTDLEEATAVYTADIDQTTMFTAHFVETLSHLLAHHIARSLTGKREIASDEMQIYQGLMRAAPAHDANEQIPIKPREAEWIRGR